MMVDTFVLAFRSLLTFSCILNEIQRLSHEPQLFARGKSPFQG